MLAASCQRNADLRHSSVSQTAPLNHNSSRAVNTARSKRRHLRLLCRRYWVHRMSNHTLVTVAARYPTVLCRQMQPRPFIRRFLAFRGFIFDCASRHELELVTPLNVNATLNIVLANTYEPTGHIAFARRIDVDTLTFHNVHELPKIRSCHPRSDLLLRIWTDDSNYGTIPIKG
jgi:Pyridoxal-dependent decarboxylase, pyridoxal binding domain